LMILPSGDRTRGWQRTLHKQGREVRTLRRYRDLYGAYGAAEVVYADSRTLALDRTLPDGAGCDSAVIDWDHYLREVHCPAVTAAFRLAPPHHPPPRPALTSGRPAPPPRRFEERRDVAAVFDLDGTIVASDVVEAHLWARLLDVPLRSWPGTLLPVLRAAPRYLRTEHRDRGEFLREFVRRYEGADEAELRALARDRLADVLLRRAWPQAIRRIRRHRAARHRTVLLTGTVDAFVEPLRALFADMRAAPRPARPGTARSCSPPPWPCSSSRSAPSSTACSPRGSASSTGAAPGTSSIPRSSGRPAPRGCAPGPATRAST